MRLSSKTIIVRSLDQFYDYDSDFEKLGFEGAIAGKGINIIHEKMYLCSCKSKESDHLNTCRNCGGSGLIFANPTKTKMIVTGISKDSVYKEAALREWGMIDTGSVKITAYPFDKLSFMDKIVVLDATAEHNEILYLRVADNSFNSQDSDNDNQWFAFTKYDIKDVDYVALFQGVDSKLKRLIEGTDYVVGDNIIKLDMKYNSLVNPVLTIRYIHNPTYHVVDIPRESMTSYANQGKTRLILPILALGKRAHLIKDVENFDGNRLFDNSWLPSTCEDQETSQFIRQLHYLNTKDLYNNLTSLQKTEIALLIANDGNLLGVNGGVLQINP